MKLSLQTIPPKAAHLVLQVERFLKDQQISLHNQKVLVGFSGGPDSTALFLILYLLRQRLNLDLGGLYLNHGLRPEAQKEEEFVLNLGQKLDCPIYVCRTKVSLLAQKSKRGLEEAGRRIRYAVLQGIARRHKYHWIALGHHLNDLAEDFLMRLIRGSIWPNLAGMECKRGQFIRPLLFLNKQEILDFLSWLGQDFCVDKTNFSLDGLRNRVRNTILPLFLRENPKFLQTIFKLWQLAQIDKQDLQEKLTKVKAKIEDKQIALERNSLARLSPGERLRVYSYYLNQLKPGQLLFANLLNLEHLFKQGETNKVIELPKNRFIFLNKETIVFLEKTK